MDSTISIRQVRKKYDLLSPHMGHRMQQLWAAVEAAQLGWGGVGVVAAATGLTPGAIETGQRELGCAEFVIPV